MADKGKFYMTTAIAYTSGKPHIGNTYEIVLADAIARYRRKQGFAAGRLPDRFCRHAVPGVWGFNDYFKAA